MMEHGHKIIDFLPILGAIIRGDKRETPTITRWIEGMILPAAGVLLALYISDGKHTNDIESLKDRTARIEQVQNARGSDIEAIRQEQASIRRDLGQRLDSIQTMLAIEISKKK